MAATNDFLPFATAGGANVVSQATYLAAVSSYVGPGRSSGVLPSNVYNKIARQSSIAAYLLGQIICDQTGLNALDNADLITLLADLKLALGMPSTGDMKPTIKTVADNGWLLLNDGTIGSASSGATNYANALAAPLFTLVYNNLSDTNAPVYTSGSVLTTRGAQGSAATAFANNCQVTLLRALGRAIGVAGLGSGLTSRALGQFFGEENHALTTSETPPISSTNVTAPGAQPAFVTFSGANGAAHNTIQPTTWVNWMIKL